MTRVVLAYVIAIACGVFVAVASNELDWSHSTTIVVGLALAALLGLLGTPLVLLPQVRNRRKE